MKIIEGFRMRSILDAHMVMPESAELSGFNKMVVLNESAAYLWESVVGKEFDAASLADLLMERYEIDADTASRDAEKIVSDWLEAGVIKA